MSQINIVNIKKTKVIVFNKSNRLIKSVSFHLNGISIDSVKEYCYLGIIISANGKFKRNFCNLKLKSMKALFSLRRLVSSDGCISVDIALDLFDRLIVPIMTYGCEVWGCEINQTKNFLDKISYSRFLLGVSKRAPINGIIGELGRFPVNFVVIKHMLKYWHRLVISDDCLLKSAYLSSMRYSNWGNYITDMLDKYSESNIWSCICNFNSTLNTIQDNLCKDFCKSWFNDLFNDVRRNGSDKDKLRTYRTFKSVFKLENYLIKIKNPTCRRLITKFRMSDFHLQIELGRRCMPKIPANERFCKYCP